MFQSAFAQHVLPDSVYNPSVCISDSMCYVRPSSSYITLKSFNLQLCMQALAVAILGLVCSSNTVMLSMMELVVLEVLEVTVAVAMS